MGAGRLMGPDAERTTFEDLVATLLDDYGPEWPLLCETRRGGLRTSESREFSFASFPAQAELLREQRVLEACFQSRPAQIGQNPALKRSKAGFARVVQVVYQCEVSVFLTR